MDATKLSGHKDTVVCLTYQQEQHLLASGSEDATARLWDEREQKCVMAIRAFGDESVNSIVFHPRQAHLVYCAHGTKVSGFDVRNERVVLTESCVEWDVCQDEVNQLSIVSSYIATADDSGAVQVICLDDGSLAATLVEHTNIASACVFRPRKSGELISGGLDMSILHWDYTKRRCLQRVNLQDDPKTTDTRVFNPPMVHAIAANSTGEYVAAACGSGEVALVSLNKPAAASSSAKKSGGVTRQLSPLRFEAHGGLVSHVHFAAFEPVLHLCSAGNDGQVKLWNLPLKVQKPPTFDLPQRNPTPPPPQAINNLTLLTTLSFDSQVNCVASTPTGTLYVADMSSDIHCHRLF